MAFHETEESSEGQTETDGRFQDLPQSELNGWVLQASFQEKQTGQEFSGQVNLGWVRLSEVLDGHVPPVLGVQRRHP